jgi:ribonuclease E
MRDEGPQAPDVYAWSWPARLSGDNPYEWRGPSQKTAFVEESPAAGAPGATIPAPAEPALRAPIPMDDTPEQEAQAPSPLADALDPAPMEDVWVELPPPDEKPARPRRRRSGGRGGAPTPVEGDLVDADESDTEAPAPQPATAANEDAPEPLLAVAEPEAEPEPEPAPEPELRSQPAPEPVYDPAEIVEPPAAPRRGWWRR